MNNTWKPFLIVFSALIIFSATLYYTKSSTYYIDGQMVPKDRYERFIGGKYKDMATKKDKFDMTLGIIVGSISGLVITMILYRKQIFNMQP